MNKCEKPKPKDKSTTAAQIGAAFFLLFLLSSFVYATTSDTVGEWQNSNTAYNSHTGFTSPNNAVYVGKLSGKFTPLTYAFTSPDTYIYPPMFSRYPTATYDGRYSIQNDGQHLTAYVWNFTTKQMTYMDTADLNMDFPKYPSLKTMIVKFSGVTLPSIIVNADSNSLNFGGVNLRFYDFNGTDLNLQCTTGRIASYWSSSPPGSDPAYFSLGYDDEFNLLVVVTGGEYFGANEWQGVTVSLVDEDCHIIANFTESNVHGGVVKWEPTFHPGILNTGSTSIMGYRGGADSEFVMMKHIYDNVNHTIVIPGVGISDKEGRGGLVWINYNSTQISGRSLKVDGADALSIYDCTDGYCGGVSESIKMTSPIMYGNNIYLARETLDGIFGSQYQIVGIDRYGVDLWDTFNTYLHNTCGKRSIIENVTFFQPIMAAVPFGGSYVNDQQPNAVCGACQPSCTAPAGTAGVCTHIYVACYDMNTGAELITTDIDYGKNLYRYSSPNDIDYDNFDRPRMLNTMITGDFEYKYTGNEIIVRDIMLSNTLDYIGSYGFEKDSLNPIVPVYGLLQSYGDTFSYNPSLALWTNETTMYVMTGKLNSVPYYVPDTFKSSSNSKPLCLNFTRDSGIKVTYDAYDLEYDTIYARHYCDINTLGGNFYNYTNWSSLPTSFGSASETVYCKYNQTGVVQYRFEITDDIHLFNTTFDEDMKSKTYTIVDNYFPYCCSDYSCMDIDNPTIPVITNDTEILKQYNITSNQTMYGAFQNTLDQFNLVTQNDKMMLGFLILFAVVLTMVFLGLASHAPREYFSIGVPVVVSLLFVAFTVFGLFPLWLTVLIFIVVSIIGAMVFLRLTGQQPMSGG